MHNKLLHHNNSWNFEWLFLNSHGINIINKFILLYTTIVRGILSYGVIAIYVDYITTKIVPQ